MHWITLTTDFGTADWFVGVMKGVVAGIAPKTVVLDLTHEVPAGDIRAGAFALWAACRFFPRGAVHLAVVDPGVGSARKAIAVQTAGSWFVGPDNGVLSWALARERVLSVHALENRAYSLQPISRTFHGRDLFAPAAAHLSRGLPVRKLGPALRDYTRLPWPEPRPGTNGVEGEVVYIDRFGNAITNLDLAMLRGLGQGPAEVWLGRKRFCPVADHYQAVPPGRPVAVPGSSGLLEIALNGASAARRYRFRIGRRVRVAPR